MRAIAVYLVLLFHSLIREVSGGYIGVDIFFVLSGYLVTQVLTRDIYRTGSISFARFYARRFRRLLPAATATLLIAGVAYSMLATPREVTEAVTGFQAAFLYVMNWYLIHQAVENLGTVSVTNPALLLWSLAVEEQFYLVWPLLLGGLFAVTRRSTRQAGLIRAIVGAGFLASVAWTLVLRHGLAARVYYGTDARAYELLAGALLALVPGVIVRASDHRFASNVMAILAFGALGFVASSAVYLDTTRRGMAATLATVLIILALEAVPAGLIARLLSLGPVVYLGRISYGVYLWQWPIILIVTRVARPNPWQLGLITAMIATGFASLSFQILERPIQEWRVLDRIPRVVVAAGLATSVICALVIVPIVLRPHRNPPRRGPRPPVTAPARPPVPPTG